MTYLLPVFKESNFGIVLPKKKKMIMLASQT